MSLNNEKSYGQILKASSIMGGSASITLLLSMVRIKYAAVLLGTTGVGLNANLTALQTVAGTVAGLGLQSSAVRDIATAASRDDQQAIGRTVLALRRLCWLTGILGMFSLILLSPLLSQLTFGHQEYTFSIAMLGVVVLFTNISGGEAALIQGTRRIDLLARVNIFSAILATVAAVISYATLGLQGIAPALVIASATQLAFTWQFARRTICVPKVNLTFWETFTEAKGMIRLGLAMMFNNLLVSAVAYITVTLITQKEGMEAVGLYAAAFGLSGMFVNFILNAMAADYYPRLTGLVADKASMIRQVNEQTEIAILLALPGLVATVTLAPWIIKIFYSNSFLGAAGLLQWFILGCMGRVISWPLGFVLLALGKGKWFIFTETSFNLLHITLIIIGLNFIGLEGVAVAFFVMYIGYISAVYYACKHLIGFSWSNDCFRVALFSLPLLGATFLTCRLLSVWPASLFGTALTIIACMISIRGLSNRIEPNNRIIIAISKIPGAKIFTTHK